MRITNVELLSAIERLEDKTDKLQNCLVGENMNNGLLKEFTILKSRFNIMCGGITLVCVPLALYLIYQVVQNGI